MEEKHNSSATATEPPPPSLAELPSSRRRGGALKRKASNLSNSNTSTPPPSSSSSKRQTREKPSPVFFPQIHNGPLTRARLQPNYTDSNSFWDAVIVNGEGEGSSALPTPVGAKSEAELKARKEAWEALEAKIEAEYDNLKSRDSNAHIVPISSGWFSWTKVHQLEEKALPSFFNGKLENRTPEIYLEIRNSIMKKFHTNPNSQIEEKDLSEITVGELDAKKEVMEFLDYWGLINYHPFHETETASSAIATSADDPKQTEKVNSLIQKLYEFEVEQLCSPTASRSSYTMPAIPSQLPESMIIDESLQPEGPSVEYHCNSCAADCSRKRYHCQKQADYDLCSECFNEGKFDSDMSPSDFILMEPGDTAGSTNSGKWTDQETLLLLEALELFSENWNDIAEHVATKTKAQCILHFVQMPIEDTFHDTDDDNEEEKELKIEKKENDEKKESGEEKGEKTEIGEEKCDLDSENVKENEDLKAVDDKNESSPMEITESVDNNININKLKHNNNNNNNIEENGENFAVKALKEAFDAVGSVSSLDDEEKFSFADAGNPVMAMAAFLTRLVGPDIVAASARTSLKSVSSGGTGLQLAARHSFVLEDPIDEKKKPDETEKSVNIDVPEMVEQEVLKEKDDSVKDDNNKNNKDTDLTENEKEKAKEKLLVSDEKKVDTVTAEVVVSKKGKNGATRKKGSSKKDKIPVTEKPVITEETNKQTHQDENPSDSKIETEVSVDGVPPVTETAEAAAPKDEEMTEKTELPLSTLAENVENPAEEKKEETEDEQKLIQAAVTAISAAAVKAKLLADQEEDSIRQLATSLMEKQLQKLETKLAFFTEMDGVVSRAREQLERSKQRLYHERAQIIAARLAMSSNSSTRPPMQHPLPNMGQRPPNPMMNMAPQRPPLSRPMMGPTPPFSNPNSAQVLNNQGMK